MKLTNKTILFEGAKIYYRTCGDENKQPILFLAGWPGIFLEKSGVLEELAKYFYVISPEHPGLLRSDPLPAYTNILEQYADTYRHILKYESLDNKKLIIMGQSFGGAIASNYAEKYPQFTKALILTDSVIGAGRVALYVKFLYKIGPKLLKLAPYLPFLVQKQIGFWTFGIPTTNFHSKSIKDRFRMTNNYANTVTRAWKNGRKIIDKNYKDFPIIFLWGDRDGKEFNLYGSCNVDDARELSEKLEKEGRNIKFLTVPGGHTILYENPSLVMNEIFRNLN